MNAAAATLNAAQLQAVHHLHGPCLVLAGAGSGKTRVIVHKIVRLLQSGIDPSRIAAITFTNKAAAEMRDRARALVGPRVSQQLLLSTFHSLGVRMLRSDGSGIGLKQNFSILDADDVLALIREAGGSTDARQARAWQWQISLWKNQGLDAAGAAAAAQGAEQAQAARVMQRYQERLGAFQSVDFDDLIVLPLKLLQTDAEARQRWQQAFSHLLVDEVQDTNAVQYELLKALAGRATPFTAVGDDDQSIYGWRGATLDNLRRLQQDFPSLKLIALEQNYRSTGAILRAANRLIEHNPKVFQKTLWSELGEGEAVAVVECDSEEHEAERAVARIQALRARHAGARHSDFAVLYRANHQSAPLEKKLQAAQIPYRVSGGQSFFDRAEIRDLCAWLRLLVNQDDDPAFLRAVTTPRRGIGHQTLAALGEFASRWQTSLFEALFSPSLQAVLKGRALQALHDFGRELNDLEHRARHTSGAEAARVFLRDWLKAIGYEQHLFESEEGAKLAQARWDNVLDFVDWIARRCGGELQPQDLGVASPARSVLEVAQTISVILSLAEREADADVVTLSTLHAAKGLEWPHVVLAGVNEGLLPFRAADQEMTAQHLQEERRLMYVGITRARLTLMVSSLRRRKRGRETVAAVPSRFIAEMKLDEGVVKVDPREQLRRLRERLEQRTAPTGQD